MILFVHVKLTKPNREMSRIQVRVKSGGVEIEYEGEFDKLAGAVNAVNRKLAEVWIIS